MNTLDNLVDIGYIYLSEKKKLCSIQNCIPQLYLFHNQQFSFGISTVVKAKSYSDMSQAKINNSPADLQTFS